MQNFTFHNPTRILFGQGRIADISREIPAGARVLITSGGGSVINTGTLDEVKAALKDFTVFEFAGIEPNPTILRINAGANPAIGLRYQRRGCPCAGGATGATWHDGAR